MAQYQSFPDAPGDSRTLQKLKALKLPEMQGKSFLDVGCNEGFFCGFALFQGADRVVGVDHAQGFIARARKRFPDCEFICAGWDNLPNEKFDIILLASALHYAEDQPKLINSLVGRLAPDGVLILELGIASSSQSEWVNVDRGIDQRKFPSMLKLKEVLKPYAWKWMGPSVSQAGDPIFRHVLHIKKKRPLAFLLMNPPGYGKSSIASELFVSETTLLISGDEIIQQIANQKISAPARLAEMIIGDYSPFQIDRLITKIFSEGLGGELVDLVASCANAGNFALDLFIPTQFHGPVIERLEGLGYFPVALNWERIGQFPLGEDAASAVANQYYESLGGTLPREKEGERVKRYLTPSGFIDNAIINEARLYLTGWAVGFDGSLPDALIIEMQGKLYEVSSLTARRRPDVQRHLGLDHDEVGFQLEINVPTGYTDTSSLRVYVAHRGSPRGQPFDLSPAIRNKMA